MPGAAAADLEILVRMANAVHARVRQALHSPRRAEIVGTGASGSPTEHLDRVAEAQILACLEAERVDWNLLSEEVGLVSRGGELTLVADPVDGSHNALRGLPFATVSLALGRHTLGEIELGLVHDLFRGETYWARRGEGAFKDGLPIRSRRWEARAELLFLNLGRHSDPRTVGLASKARRIRSLGCASFEMAQVAQGAADAYVFDNESADRNLRVTDIAAAYRILVEAGGGASDVAGRSLDQVRLTADERTSVFAWGDPQFAASAQREGYR